MDIIIIGAQGSGKGTQAGYLAEYLKVHHLSSGDMFRKAFENHTALGIKAREYIDRGELVPDNVTVDMVLEHIARPEYRAGVLLDGFPRTIAQSQALDKGLEALDRSVTFAIYLNVPREELVHRLAGRYICRAHQHVYNSETNPPHVPGICDLDGSELYQRSDDKGEAIQKRLDTFFSETIHLLDFYQQQGKLIEVNGNQGIELVREDMRKAIERFRH
ncbi:adenylate kinase [Tengunoibacter tsumagoiensis]|uniref:Adenylate kinase n=1 Tax=Tengunoibacter tsumagoiensis TaxID=2014871 RepID=A0A401ZTY7_9CHLR|nr:adenylate kinase [Tengunoibacter tsumagoiensis]GCE10355.1 adenylate kinase [Tengunoibacter tsumagoiensis]